MSKKILVADDQPGIRMLLKEVFLDEGYNVATAETGQDVLDSVYDGAYDLLVLDYKMPVVHGADILRRLEDEKISIPTIVMSGLVEDIKRDIDRLPIVRKVFAKPFNIQEVSGFVRSLLT